MNQSLLRWINYADAAMHIERFKVPQITIEHAEMRNRADDYYIALVGELFTRMRTGSVDSEGWSKLGNALAQIAAPGQEKEMKRVGISQSEATLFAAAAFYCGGFPASAYITIRSRRPDPQGPASYMACTDLLGRPNSVRSELGGYLIDALASGEMWKIEEVRLATEADSRPSSTSVPANGSRPGC